MKPIGDIHSGWTGAARDPANRAHGLQKISTISPLRHRARNESPDRPAQRLSNGQSCSPQSGTGRTVLFRYGPDAPRLTAAFVAQLLGQVLPDPEHKSAPDYGRAARTPPSALDEHL